MTTILAAKDLCKLNPAQGKPLHLLQNINLEISQGEFVSLMGPSGSGKSTLLYNLSGMDKMSSGSVTFKGQELATLTDKELSSIRLTKMGFIFQQFHLLKNLNVFDNITFSAHQAKKFPPKVIAQKAERLMANMGIANLNKHDITQVSGGQLQRAAICRSLINDPAIIFGDEPTGALNSTSAKDIMKILASVNETGTTILLATHDIKVAAHTERVIYILDGQIVSENYLGKYYPADNQQNERENKLAKWLTSLGF